MIAVDYRQGVRGSSYSVGRHAVTSVACGAGLIGMKSNAIELK